jgi:hypothetical protein
MGLRSGTRFLFLLALIAARLGPDQPLAGDRAPRHHSHLFIQLTTLTDFLYQVLFGENSVAISGPGSTQAADNGQIPGFW